MFAGVAARAGASATVMEPSGAANAQVGLVPGNFFEMLGVRAALGRAHRSGDGIAGGVRLNGWSCGQG